MMPEDEYERTLQELMERVSAMQEEVRTLSRQLDQVLLELVKFVREMDKKYRRKD